MRTFNILHLSDLHIGENDKELNNLVDNLGNTLKLQKIHAVVFTGDIFHEPPVKGKVKMRIDEEKKEELIKTAVWFFEKLLEYLKQGNRDLGKKNFWFVAGNHDLYRQTDIDTWNLYDGFLDKFYENNKPEEYIDEHMIIKVDSDNQKILLGFNSNIAEIDNKIFFTEHITKNQLNTANIYLEEHPEYQGYDKIAFFHHPCNMFEELGYWNTDGILNNSLDVSIQLAKWNVKLVLYGHKHWAKPSIYRPFAGQKIYLFAGGAIGRLRDQCSGNIIMINEKKEIFLKQVVSNNDENFKVSSKNVPDDYMDGLLKNTIYSFWQNCNQDEEFILDMINKLFLNYEQLNILQYDKFNIYFFENSIKYRLKQDIREDLFEDIGIDKWNAVKTILDSPEIPSNVKERLQISPTERRYIAFALLGSFFTDLYIAIMDVDSVIQSKISTEFNLGTSCYYIFFNLSRDPNEIVIRQNLNKIMEEFQGRLYELQDFLYCIKLDIKNIFLELRDDHGEIRHCDFDASVSRLIQLLTGTNIYFHEYTFVRELIQNSIDAVSFWEKQNPNKKFITKLDTPISVELGCDDKRQKYFKIRDYGIGMKKEIIEKYFTTLGRSYYKEYTERRNINYNSVSNFGIGFLSVFKPCCKIVINTRHFSEQKCYNLEINSNCGYYTISCKSQPNFSAGTEITCYFKDPNVDYQKIISYIRKIMLDIKYNISIQNGTENEQPIKARKVREDYDNVIFIPFDEETKCVKALEGKDGQKWENTLSDAMKTYRHGILISTRQKDNFGADILSAGILLANAKLQDVFKENTKELKELQHMKVTLNFPPNWLDIDVSREKVNGIRIDNIKDNNSFKNMAEFKQVICNEIRKQVWKVFKERKNIPLIFFKEASMLVEALEPSNRSCEEQNVWNLNLCFEREKIKFYLNPEKAEITSNDLFHKWVLNIVSEYHNDNITYKRNHVTIKLMYNNLPHDETSAIIHLFQGEKEFDKSRDALQKLGLDVEGVDNQYMPLVPAIILNKTKSQENTTGKKELHQFIETAVWDSCTVKDIEKSNGLFSVMYDNLEKNKHTMVSDKLKDRVDIMIRRYEIPIDHRSDSYPYDFVWTYIIKNSLTRCGLDFKDNDNVQSVHQEKYEHLRETIKILYFKGEELLLDIYTIASCYMSVLMDISKERLKFQKNTSEMAKYRWIFNVGLGLLYMWILSDGENSENNISGKERSNMLFELYNQKRLDSLFSKKLENRCIKLLAAQERKTFDVLCFAELLRWIDDNIKEKISLILS